MSIDALEETFRSRPWGRYPSEAVIRAFARMPRRSAVLDLGCGPGANTWFLAREGFDTYGLDASRTAVDLCRRRLIDEGLVAFLTLADFTKPLPYPDRSFDAVLDSAALYCVSPSDIANAVAEVHRILRPGGSFLSLAFSTETTRDVGADATLMDGDDIERLYRPFLPLTVDTYTRIDATGECTQVLALQGKKK